MNIYDIASPATTGGTRWTEDTLITPEPWTQDALCAQIDPDLFFPGKAEHSKARDAKKVCASCPVATMCLEYALRTDQKHGIWGGLNTQDRSRLRSRKTPRPRERCVNGHDFDAENTCHTTYVDRHGNRRPRRKCLTCDRESARRKRERAS